IPKSITLASISRPGTSVSARLSEPTMDELVAHSHKFRVPMSERNGRRGLQRAFEYEGGNSTPTPLVALTHASHITCVSTIPEFRSIEDKFADVRNDTVIVSELQLVATGRLEISCVSTIPEFRSIEDKFADVRNDT
ncbi:hypothetical protein OBRU01_18454, partial [Operophtera brumata]